MVGARTPGNDLRSPFGLQCIRVGMDHHETWGSHFGGEAGRRDGIERRWPWSPKGDRKSLPGVRAPSNAIRAAAAMLGAKPR